MTRETPTHVFEEPDFHETADTTTPLVVNFVVPSTTAEEYDLLYSAISDQVRVNSTPEPQSPVVSVTEDTFIDREDDSDPYTSEEQEVYTEYDRAYFEDFLMVRYVSQSGVIHVVGARLGGEDGTEIELYDQSDFTSEHFSAVVIEKEGKENYWKFWERSGKELEEEIEAEMESSGAISEDTFVACIGQCTLELLTRAESWERILSHFTAEGMASLLRIVQVLEIGEECAVKAMERACDLACKALEFIDNYGKFKRHQKRD
jgi:hypothetical protein